MKRTIDGIDYIAKSEVLRIIDRQIEEDRWLSKSDAISDDSRQYWSGGEGALLVLRYRLTNNWER